MLKPIVLLLGAAALTSTNFAPAQADTNKIVTILTMMETGKPTIVIDLSDAKGGINFKGRKTIYDGGKLTKTAIIQDDFEFTGKDKEGKQFSYKFKSGVAVFTTTLVKTSNQQAPKAANKPKV